MIINWINSLHMKRLILVALFVIPTLLVAQNKYSMKDVNDFKYGLILSSKNMNKSVPIQINEYQTLIAVGTQENLITYKYQIDDWSSTRKMTKEEVEQSKSLAVNNMWRSQLYPDMFLECLRRTKLEFQILYFTDSRFFIGGFRISYDDFMKLVH